MRKTLKFVALVVLCVLISGFLTALFDGGSGNISLGGGGSTESPEGCRHVGNLNESYRQLDRADGEYLTKHIYSKTCFDCSKTLVEPIRVDHAYINGVCKCGFACDHPGADAAGNCIQCHASVNVSFIIEGVPFSVTRGSTWMDIMIKYPIFAVDANNRVTYEGKCLVDSSGYAVHATYQVVPNEVYRFCTHTNKQNASIKPSEMIDDEHLITYTCGACDLRITAFEDCVFSGGVCTICGRTCQHDWNDVTCTICGTTHAHNYVDSVCTICHDGCAHTWSEGTCTACQTVCKHPGEYPDGVCEVCGVAQLGFEIDGDHWVVPEGGTWADMLKYTQAFTLDENDRILYKGGVLLGQNAQPVGKYYTIEPGKSYHTCTHEASSVTYTKILDDNSAHAVSYVCGVCGDQSTEMLQHTFDASSVCVDCGHECTHVVEDGACQWCGKPLYVFLVNDNYFYFVSPDSSWADLIATYPDEFENTNGKIYWRGYLLTDVEGYAVKPDMSFSDSGRFYTCQHKHVGNAHGLNPNTGSLADKQHQRIDFCDVCGVEVSTYLENHIYTNGKCDCTHECQHPLGDGLLDHCEQCGVEWHYFTVDGYRYFFAPGMTYGDLERFGTSFGCDFKAEADNGVTLHSKPMKYTDGTNVPATDTIGAGDILFAAHTYDDDGICTDCGAECPHGLHDQDGNCTTCGKLVGHGIDNYDDDNVCKICGYQCPHDNFIDGDCEYCGRPPVIRAGTYRFNDVLTANRQTTNFQDINFTVSSFNYALDMVAVACCYRIFFHNVGNNGEDFGFQMGFLADSTVPDLSSYGVTYPLSTLVYSDNNSYGFIGWTDDYDNNIKTITIPEDTEVSAEFYTWFIVNVARIS